jgi:hypothetical protein
MEDRVPNGLRYWRWGVDSAREQKKLEVMLRKMLDA